MCNKLENGDGGKDILTSKVFVMSKAKGFIDKDWFKGKLADNKKSMRGLAKHLDLDIAAVSRTLSGDRKMTMQEANQIALFLGTHVSEVLKHAGAQPDNGHDAPNRIMLAATINENGQVERILEPVLLPQTVLDRAHAAITIHGPGKIIAAQVRALAGPLTLLDDAVLLFSHTDVVENDAIGVLSICRNRKGEQILAKIERARKTGEATLICTDGKVKEFTLHTATPILAIIP